MQFRLRSALAHTPKIQPVQPFSTLEKVTLHSRKQARSPDRHARANGKGQQNECYVATALTRSPWCRDVLSPASRAASSPERLWLTQIGQQCAIFGIHVARSCNERLYRCCQRNPFQELAFDLLTPEEEAVDLYTAQRRFDINLLAEKLLYATRWALEWETTHYLRIGYFGSSTGAGAALVAAAEHPRDVGAVVSRGGRPDLVGDALARVHSPTLLIVGSRGGAVIGLNEQARRLIRCEVKLKIVPGATHLFEEPGTLERVTELTVDWFLHHIAPTGTMR